MNYFFLEEAFLTNNFAIWDLILAALFLWITFLLLALSAKEIALRIFSSLLVFLACRIELSSLLIVSLLTISLARLPLKALLAVFVTGIVLCL